MESKCPHETLRIPGMNLNMCILRMLDDTCSLGTAHNYTHIIMCAYNLVLYYQSMERSFEDLLHGLSDESDPDLDDMITHDTDYSGNLEVCDTCFCFRIFSPDRKPA